jgi:hypothetical protein
VRLPRGARRLERDDQRAPHLGDLAAAAARRFVLDLHDEADRAQARDEPGAGVAGPLDQARAGQAGERVRRRLAIRHAASRHCGRAEFAL